MYPERGQLPCELRGRVIAAAVAVEYRAFRQGDVPGRHLDRLCYERGPVIIVHRSADDLPGRAVDNRGEVKPPLPRRDVRDVADHFPAGSDAVKSRFTRSGIGPAAPCSVSERRHGRGWHGTRPSSRISRRTSSALARSPPRTSSAWTRRYPYSLLFASNSAFT